MNYGAQAYVVIFSILQSDPGISMKKLDDSLKETTTNDPQSPVQPRVLFFKSIKFLGKEEYQTRYFLWSKFCKQRRHEHYYVGEVKDKEAVILEYLSTYI